MDTAQKPTETKTKAADKKPVIVSLVGEMTHLFTGAVFDARGIEHEVDGFVQAQIAAGKLAIKE